MDREPDEQLKTQFLSLLLKADPNLVKRQALAEEFAGRLAAFTKDWAISPKDVDEQHQFLSEWIDSHAEKAAARPKAMGVGAGAGGSRARRRPAKKR